MMPEHTPLPWVRMLGTTHYGRGYYILAADGSFVAQFQHNPEGLDAVKRTVRAVNSQDELLAALRAVEWHRTSAKWGTITTDVCPSCGETVIEGHAPDCQLANALALVEGK